MAQTGNTNEIAPFEVWIRKPNDPCGDMLTGSEETFGAACQVAMDAAQEWGWTCEVTVGRGTRDGERPVFKAMPNGNVYFAK